MKTFNLTSYATGGIIKRIKAETLLQATEICHKQGYSLDDEFLETVEETAQYDSMQGRTIYIDEIIKF
ncbi:MAG TPA: hypothetical protein DCM02_08175 [Flavobacterium sp.]|nr:hypothetical protein [Flavobacterium sp.]